MCCFGNEDLRVDEVGLKAQTKHKYKHLGVTK